MAEADFTASEINQDECAIIPHPAGAHLAPIYLRYLPTYQPIVSAGAEAASQYVRDCQSFKSPRFVSPTGFAAEFLGAWMGSEDKAYRCAVTAAKSTGVIDIIGNFERMFVMAFMFRLEQELQCLPRNDFHSYPITNGTMH